MALRKVLYIKVNSSTPSMTGRAVNCFLTDHTFSPRELATTGHPIIFGNFIMDVSADEEILVQFGRRNVNDVNTPTALVSV